MLEDEDQRGLAHFVEHMAFNGTQHFPGGAVGSFMQSLGMRFGAHVNAHTSFDETVYELQIPTDNPAVIDRSLLILEDFARNVSFDPEEIDKERGVVLEEWRLGLGADERIRDAQFPVLLKGSRYADRLPIGKPEIIRNVTTTAETVLHGLVPPGPDGGGRRRRFQQGRDRGADQIPFRLDPGCRVTPKPRPAYTVPDQPGTDVFGEHRSGSHQHAHQRDQHDAGTRADDDRLLPAAHGGAVLRRDAVHASRRNRPVAECAVSAGADRSRTASSTRRR